MFKAGLIVAWLQQWELQTMNNSHQDPITQAAKEDALGEALAKAKQMSFAEAKAVYGDDFKIKQTVREMRARGWGVQGRIKTTMRSCGFKHQDFYYEFLHYPKGVR